MRNLFITFLMLGSTFLNGNLIYSQTKNLQTEGLNGWIDSKITQGLDSFNIAGATIVVMQGDSILHLNGYGLANIETNTPVNVNNSIFTVASVSKTFVGTAVMKLYEDGLLDIDKDINNYLKTFQLEYQFNDSITVRHLLTHTAGFDDINMGTIVQSEEDVIPLAQYVKERMSPQLWPSGKVRLYSNYGYALLGCIVEEVSGVAFHEFVQKKILKPLEMNYSGFKKQDELKENYVTSYFNKIKLQIPYKRSFHLFYPASSFRSTASDMGHYISMFLNNGRFKENQFLDSTTVVKMHQTGFKHYENANIAWLLGFYESKRHGVRTVEHSGGLQGFSSLLTLMPDSNLGVFICVNSSNFLNQKSRVFVDSFVNELFARLTPQSKMNKTTPHLTVEKGNMDEPLDKLAGKYRFTRYAHTTMAKISVLLGFAPEIDIVLEDNRLKILPWNETLEPASDLTFHSNYNRYSAFGKNANGEISNFFIDQYAYEKIKWYEPVSFQLFWIGIIFFVSLAYILVSSGRSLFARNKNRYLIKKVNFIMATLIVLFIALFTYGLLTTDVMEYFYGIPSYLKIALVIPLVLIPLVLWGAYLLFKAIKFKELKTVGLVFQSLILVAAMLFIPWLKYYNLIGFNY